MKKLIISIIISASFLYLALRKIDWEVTINALKGANYFWLIPSFIFGILGLLLRALRWQWLLLPAKKIKVGHLFSSTVIGFMGNFLLPARAGELIRIYTLSKKAALSKSTSLATVVLERILDGISIFLFAIVAILVIPKLPKEIKLAGYFSCLLFFLLFIVLFLFRHQEKRVSSFVKRITKIESIQKRLIHIISTFSSGLAILEKKAHFFIVILYSFFVWLSTVLSFYFLFFAFPELVNLSLIAACVVMVTVAFGVALPQAPGFVGTYQYFCIIAFSLFGVSQNIALSYSVVAHLMGFLPAVSLGLFFLHKEGISLSKVKDLK
jgi:uncharacterized protein (TIRG00374 family)